jgi:hypothetical protein
MDAGAPFFVTPLITPSPPSDTAKFSSNCFLHSVQQTPLYFPKPDTASSIDFLDLGKSFNKEMAETLSLSISASSLNLPTS